MSVLYTKLMERVTPFLQDNWQFTIIGCGVLFLLGAVFNWKWTWDPNGHRILGCNAWIYGKFGEKGARINAGINGIIIIICGVVLWVLM